MKVLMLNYKEKNYHKKYILLQLLKYLVHLIYVATKKKEG